jgi:hypothetical protein
MQLKIIHEDPKQQWAERAALFHPNDALESAGQALGCFHTNRHISIQRLQGGQHATLNACALQRRPQQLPIHTVKGLLQGYKENAISEPARLMCVVLRRSSKQE